MGKFYVHRHGRLAWTGECGDGQEEFMAPPGYQSAAGEPPAYLLNAPPPVSETYDMQRKRHYPPIGDQLDAIWKLVGSLGTDATPARDMLAKIEEVKARFPKPSN